MGFLLKGEINLKIAEDFKDLCKKLYDYFHPIYGYLFSAKYEGTDEFNPTEEQIKDLNLRHIHRLNFFSPVFVDKLGKKKLLGIPELVNGLTTEHDEDYLEFGEPLPVCSVEELSDGGILLSLSKNPSSINYDKQEMIAKELGFG